MHQHGHGMEATHDSQESPAVVSVKDIFVPTEWGMLDLVSLLDDPDPSWIPTEARDLAAFEDVIVGAACLHLHRDVEPGECHTSPCCHDEITHGVTQLVARMLGSDMEATRGAGLSILKRIRTDVTVSGSNSMAFRRFLGMMGDLGQDQPAKAEFTRAVKVAARDEEQARAEQDVRALEAARAVRDNYRPGQRHPLET